MKSVRIYDPAMCCPTGVCGPSVDPELTRVASSIFILEKKGMDIQRFNIANEPAAFVEQSEVNQLLQEKGNDALPLVMVDGTVEKVGGYPTNEELASWFDVSPEELTPEKPRIRLNLNLKPE